MFLLRRFCSCLIFLHQGEIFSTICSDVLHHKSQIPGFFFATMLQYNNFFAIIVMWVCYNRTKNLLRCLRWGLRWCLQWCLWWNRFCYSSKFVLLRNLLRGLRCGLRRSQFFFFLFSGRTVFCYIGSKSGDYLLRRQQKRDLDRNKGTRVSRGTRGIFPPDPPGDA